MRDWTRLVSPLGAGRVVAALGSLYLVAAAVLTWSLAAANASVAEMGGRFALLAIPGITLLYGGYRVPEMGLHPDVRARVVAWTFRGIGVMIVIVVVMDTISPSGVDNPAFALPLASAIGSVGGFGAGVHDARARTRERELEETVAQLRTSNERLEQFAYAASHDLQEPLRMVSSYLQLLDNRYGDDLDEEGREFLEFAVDGADRMRAMIDSLLEYSQVTAGGGSFEPTDVGDVLDSVRDDLTLRIEETNATITADELPTVTAHPHQLAQVFQNLLTNALIYSGDEPPVVHVSAERIDDEWRFAVSDEGIGIDAEYQDRIFTVFEQLHPDSETVERGAGGVGLALCERIVEHHGGEIWVESEPGEGTTVYFTIPVSEDRERPPPNVPSARE